MDGRHGWIWQEVAGSGRTCGGDDGSGQNPPDLDARRSRRRLHGVASCGGLDGGETAVAPSSEAGATWWPTRTTPRDGLGIGAG